MSDLDHHDWLDGPHRQPNAACCACFRLFFKGRDEVGDLCNACCTIRDIAVVQERSMRRVREIEAEIFAKK